MAGEVEKVAELEGQVTDLEAQVAELTKKLASAGPEGDAAITKQLDEATKALSEASTAIEKLTKERDEAVAIAKLTAAEKDHCDGMSAEDKQAFMAKSPEDRQKEMGKKAAMDETVTIEGQTIKKSAVGEATFAILKAQADRITKNEEALKVEKAAREKVELEKQADDKYPHVPGTIEERGQMLGAIAKMDEPLKKAFEKVFEQSEKLAKAGFDKIGSNGGDDSKDTKITKAARDFDGKVAEIKKRDNCSRTEALAKARKENPDLFKAYQDSEASAAN